MMQAPSTRVPYRGMLKDMILHLARGSARELVGLAEHEAGGDLAARQTLATERREGRARASSSARALSAV